MLLISGEIIFVTGLNRGGGDEVMIRANYVRSYPIVIWSGQLVSVNCADTREETVSAEGSHSVCAAVDEVDADSGRFVDSRGYWRESGSGCRKKQSRIPRARHISWERDRASAI